MPVTLVEQYNPEWPRWFETIRGCLDGALKGVPHRIEHVGSTSVPGLVAKPIIDLNIVIESGAFPAVKECLADLGFRHEGDKGIPGREAFRLTGDQATAALPPHHLYVCEEGTYELRKQRAFRDFMRTHPEWRAKLSRLKWDLCERYDNDRPSYIDGKSEMVQEITRLALGEAHPA